MPHWTRIKLKLKAKIDDDIWKGAERFCEWRIPNNRDMRAVDRGVKTTTNRTFAYKLGNIMQDILR